MEPGSRYSVNIIILLIFHGIVYGYHGQGHMVGKTHSILHH